MFKIKKSDMDAKQARFILDTLAHLSGDDVTSDWESIAGQLKSILDSRFGGEWNILIGRTVGFSMKTRKKSSIILNNSSGDMVICWKSPGFEVEDSDIVKIKTKIVLEEKDVLLEKSVNSKKLNIIASPSPESVGYTSETPVILSLLEVLSEEIKDMDHQASARHVRNQYVTKSLSHIYRH